MKPAPVEKMAANRPSTFTSPVVGLETPEMILSSVLLPAPLRPRTPNVAPGFISRSMSSTAQNSWVLFPLPGRSRSFIHEERLEEIL